MYVCAVRVRVRVRVRVSCGSGGRVDGTGMLCGVELSAVGL